MDNDSTELSETDEAAIWERACRVMPSLKVSNNDMTIIYVGHGYV